jgi:hypothetical protein
MAETNNVVLEHLYQTRGAIQGLREVKQRLGRIERIERRLDLTDA